MAVRYGKVTNDNGKNYALATFVTALLLSARRSPPAARQANSERRNDKTFVLKQISGRANRPDGVCSLSRIES
jgi:hypothetical protein